MLAAPIPDYLPGEPLRQGYSSAGLLISVILRSLIIPLFAIATLLLWPFYLLSVLAWGWPPNVPRSKQFLRYLRLTWTLFPPEPGLPFLKRCWLTTTLLRKAAFVPIWGLAWNLDEALYGQKLKANPVVAPLIEISAARSGSTQLARYLEDDPHLVAPSLLQSVFPYLWLWHLASATLGRITTKEEINLKVSSILPSEFIERHEGDLFRTDTFDGALYISHLNQLSLYLGPEVAIDDFGFATIAPHNKSLWEKHFIDLTDGIGRKTLAFAGPGPGGKPRRFFVKGHFLCAGPALERRYPEARFLTMLRPPAPRFQSAINYIRVNPMDPAMGAVPWTWLKKTILEAEADYCRKEQAWFGEGGQDNKCVIRFVDYVKDLEGAMSKVYAECLDTPILPDYAPRQHLPRERSNYQVNRSLADLGIDEEAINADLAAYIEWCKG